MGAYVVGAVLLWDLIVPKCACNKGFHASGIGAVREIYAPVMGWTNCSPPACKAWVVSKSVDPP